MFDIDAYMEFSFVLTLTALLGVIATRLKQPPILGYILAGFLVGPMLPSIDLKSDSFSLLSDIGITLLLFTLGLELKITELKNLGKISLLTGIGQIVFTSIGGFFISIFLGFNWVEAFFISICLTFSSTVIILKLLSSKNELDTLHGKISVGFLIVQDFVAILILIALSTLKSLDYSSLFIMFYSLLTTVLKGVVLILLTYVVTKKLLYRVLDSLRQEREVLFLVSISWALVVASIFSSDFVGLTKEVGGLVAGMFLSNRFESLQLESWTKPIRDFFLALFFVILGSSIDFGSAENVLFQTVVLSLFVLLGNPLIVMIIMGLFGFHKKTSFLTSLAVAQISEFSLIVANYAYKDLGLLDHSVLTVIALVGAITMGISSYMIYYNSQIYGVLERFLGIFQFKRLVADLSKDFVAGEDTKSYKSKKILICGFHRMGERLINLLASYKDQVLVVEIDIFRVRKLKEEGFDVLFGDISNHEFLRSLNLENFDLIISTVPSIHDSKAFLGYLNSKNISCLKVFTATEDNDVKELYQSGADFVIYPHVLGSKLLKKIIRKRKLGVNLVNHRRELISVIS